VFERSREEGGPNAGREEGVGWGVGVGRHGGVVSDAAVVVKRMCRRGPNLSREYWVCCMREGVWLCCGVCPCGNSENRKGGFRRLWGVRIVVLLRWLV